MRPALYPRPFGRGFTADFAKQQRIEHRGKNLRVSRTGGVALRTQAKAAGLTITANSQHGLRVSSRVAKNTQVALQNGRPVLRGRYGSGATRLNLSKSGVSVSTRNPLGTFNWSKPNRSSVKIAGVQLRGKKSCQHPTDLYVAAGHCTRAASVLADANAITAGDSQTLHRIIALDCKLTGFIRQSTTRFP